ncbi:MAG: maleylpyruvate isomerase N-terminal domain-containing protein [Acidobacteria bacterium]|nr:maleylpyruvate isomerase N-terminal domain-containing protein [Acidobacteriota bacterium]
MSRDGIAGLEITHRSDIEPILHSLSDEEWELPTACEGWRIHEAVAHMTSNMKLFVDPEPMPEPEPGAGPPGAEEIAELLLTERRGWTHGQVLDEYDAVLDGFLAALGSFQDEPMASTVTDLGDLGEHPMHIFSNMFVFDHYCHLRIDMLTPGGALEREVAPADDLRILPGIEWMFAGLPAMCSDTLTVVDKPLRIDLTGPGESTWTIEPPVEGSTLVNVTGASDDAAAVATSSAHDFVSWGTKRSDWRDAVTLSGDSQYAIAVLDAINVI